MKPDDRKLLEEIGNGSPVAGIKILLKLYLKYYNPANEQVY